MEMKFVRIEIQHTLNMPRDKQSNSLDGPALLIFYHLTRKCYKQEVYTEQQTIKTLSRVTQYNNAKLFQCTLLVTIAYFAENQYCSQSVWPKIYYLERVPLQ